MSDARPPESASRYGTWIPGIVLIGIGLIFLAQNYLGQEIRNWWALFILIPVFFTLERGYASLRGGRNAEALGQLWPIFLIIGGITLLISRSWRT